jgi:hypothetical protein
LTFLPVLLRQSSTEAATLLQSIEASRVDYQRRLEELSLRKQAMQQLGSELSERKRAHTVTELQFAAETEQRKHAWTTREEALRFREDSVRVQEQVCAG